MQRWQYPFLGLTHIPATLSPFEIRWFFTLSETELAAVCSRHRPLSQLGIALQLGFLRMTGRLLNDVKLLPGALLEHLGGQLQIEVPALASIRALYRRKRTLYEHQVLAVDLLGFHKLPEKARPWLAKHLREEAASLMSADELVLAARRWLYAHHYFIPNERVILDLARESLALSEDQLLAEVEAKVPPAVRARWLASLLMPHPHAAGISVLEWLQEPPRKHSPRHFTETLEKIRLLIGIGAHEFSLSTFPLERLRAYASRMIRRRPARFARLKEPRRTLELVAFIRYTLLRTTDMLLLQFERRVAELWRAAYSHTLQSEVQAAAQYRAVLARIGALLDDPQLEAEAFREHTRELLGTLSPRRYRSRTEAIRHHLLRDAVRVHSLMRQMVELRFETVPDHPLSSALDTLRTLYASGTVELPAEVKCAFSPRWDPLVQSPDRRAARHAFAAATMLYSHDAACATARHGSITA